MSEVVFEGKAVGVRVENHFPHALGKRIFIFGKRFLSMGEEEFRKTLSETEGA